MRLLVIAGHDASGAGIDADRAALVGEKVDACFVVTARTQQDSRAVRAIGARAVADWYAEARREVELGVGAIKFGLLPGRAHFTAARALVDHAHALDARTHIVLDPVIAASSGDRFLGADDVEALRDELLRARVVLTPNLAEAAELARVPLERLEHETGARLEAANTMLALGLQGVVLKGGHGREDPALDLVLEANGHATWLAHPRIPGAKIRGSGCRFATRLAARLALGATLPQAAQAAADLVRSALEGR